MQTSSLKKFFKLYSKEMRELRPEILVVLIATLVLNLFFYFKAQELPAMVIVPSMMMLGLAGFLPFISSFKLLGREWNSNTIYLLLSLPVKGGNILGSKLLALLTQYLIGTVVVTTGGVILTFLLFPEPGLAETLRQVQASGIDTRLQTIISSGGLFYLMSLVGMAYIIAISFFSQLLGKLVTRFSGLITAIVFIATFWLMNKLMTPIWQQLGNYNQLHMSQFNFSIAAFNQLVGMNTLIMLAGTAIVFVAAVLVYNHKIEL
jgi:ABC-type transport system involved in multi-copper enzyme maturation permease subunit